LKQRRRHHQSGALHVFLAPGVLVEARVTRDTVPVGPHPATNGSVIGVGDGGHGVLHAPEEPGLTPSRKRGHRALLQIVQAESIDHQHNHPLRLALGEGRRTQQDRAGSQELSAAR